MQLQVQGLVGEGFLRVPGDSPAFSYDGDE